MKFSELADVYDRISEAGNDAKRVALLAEVFGKASEKELPAVAHLSLGELVRREYSDRLGIGPATIRDKVAEIAGKTPAEIDDEVRESGDMSGVAAAYADGGDIFGGHEVTINDVAPLYASYQLSWFSVQGGDRPMP